MASPRSRRSASAQLTLFDGTRALPYQEEVGPTVAKTSVERRVMRESERAPSERASLTQVSTEQEIAIFRRLFRGRQDVYPLRWENMESGASGYTPECSNKFVKGICDTRHVRCRACQNRVYRSVTDDAILRHLNGGHVMGVYPLLPDDTCRFLAIDFDKNHWQHDIGAVRNTCRVLEIPAYVERSRSGKGGHAWFFFSEPVPSIEARRLGSYVLTETMNRYPNLPFASYDRLFPNQDTMPKGGFGNLIALPLQGASLAKGNSAFVNEEFVAYPGDEQWTMLSKVVRLSRDQVAEIANQAVRTDRVLDVGLAREDDDEEATSPWTRSPSGKPKPLRVVAPLPVKISAVLAQRLFVRRADLPPALLNRIRRLAAFQNPEFYKKQSLRLPIARTPRIIYLAEDTERHIALPRGCAPQLADLAHQTGIPLELDDKRYEGTPLDVSFRGELTDIQTQALDALSKEDMGVLVAPPGIGKTVVGIALIAKRARNTLILVHRRPLQDQWRQQLARFLNLDLNEIGEVRGKKPNQNGRLDVAMMQSLLTGHSVNDLVTQYGHIIVDECHHVPAVTFERVLSAIPARYVTGLTATPHRQDGRDPIMRMQLGPTRLKVSAKFQAAARPFQHVLIVRDTNFTPSGRRNVQICPSYVAGHSGVRALQLYIAK